MQSETGSRVFAYHPLELRATIHSADQIVFIFRSVEEWIKHVIRHFANRSEPWARALGNAAPTLYSLRDSIPGNTDEQKESYVDALLPGCQKEDDLAVSILEKACKAYASAGPLIVQQLRQALEVPRYAHFPTSNPLSRSEIPGISATYAIGEVFPAVMVVRGVDLRTCYFIPGIKGTQADLPAVQSYVFRSCGLRRAGVAWHDRGGSPGFPYTDQTMGWSRSNQPAQPARSWQFGRPRRGDTR